MNTINNITNSWNDILSLEFSKEYFTTLNNFILDEQSDYTIYPNTDDIFNAYNITSIEDIKVVVLGQDPYHGLGQAHGLAFSVLDGVKYPPSLHNIFKELSSDIGCDVPSSGNLTPWAKQGVFLINAVLTVRAGAAGSHQKKGWEMFTDATIKAISQNCENIVFILWGKPAQLKEKIIDSSKHLVLKAPHPSPLSSYRGFFGSKPFSLTNEYLKLHNKEEIDWCIN